MDVWYTPERAALYLEVEQRRMERNKRRAERAMRRERVMRILSLVKLGLQTILGAAILYLYLFFGCLWASM